MREQREEGEVEGERETGKQKDCLLFQIHFSLFNKQIKMVLGYGHFFFNVRLLMYGLQLSTQLSDSDIKKLEPKAGRVR